MKDGKKVNMKVMENLSEPELMDLINTLKKTKKFEFLVDAPFRINN